MKQSLKIGRLAEMTGCPVETIRYYEKQGLLPEPERSEGNYRLYGPPHAERLQFIRNCRSLDMTLDEISRLLRFRDHPDQNCTEVNVLLEEHIGHVKNRISELQGLQKQLQALRGLCQNIRPIKECGILRSLAKPPKKKAGPLEGKHHRQLKRTHTDPVSL